MEKLEEFWKDWLKDWNKMVKGKKKGDNISYRSYNTYRKDR